ncbi:hypothetical protein M409DRAFT_26950 [Zasmidium cellare ATCC 36951]|uniref:DUF7730 domain-containing protein n=1 Tax=Zasmidium cellare ATCC 36951 TaxID=1080233 RepID=A0A6A6C799_ZASCE|nr:uncharacterized protein M409DRAFT_26950 [Zasmidium cellare ATCC 36951]KAF2162713.1 hypothetical protein M409DRAFT_26950 [Zasmidium cellare ATCC 36951]
MTRYNAKVPKPVRKASATTRGKDKLASKTTLLDLPAELRVLIYDLALENQTIVFPEPSKSNPKGRAHHPGLLMVSKEIYLDTRVIYYYNSTFHLNSVDRTFSWLRRLKPGKRILLRKVIVDDMTLNFHSPSTTVVDIPQQQHKTTTKFVRMPRNSRALNKSTPNMAVNNTTPKKDKTPKTSFLDLPAEIRNDIYTLALTNRTLSFPPASPQNRYGRARPPSLLLSNKQIHHETLPMFYSNTTFHFPSPDPLLRWLRKIGAKKRVLVKEIIVDEKAPSSAGPSLGLQAHEMLRVLERRLRDAGVRLPVEVYKPKEANEKPFGSVSGPNQPQHGSGLLRLPAELRNRIYALTLNDVVAYRARKTVAYRKVHRVKAKAPGLLLACKQTYTEAVQLFYSQTTFLFDDKKHIHAWARKIGSERTALVKSLRLSSPMPQHSVMASSFWDPRTALWLFAVEASTRMLQVKHGLPKALKKCKLQTDLYLPGSPKIEVVWTQQPVMVVEEFLEEADEDALGQTHQAFLMLANARHIVW